MNNVMHKRNGFEKGLLVLVIAMSFWLGSVASGLAAPMLTMSGGQLTNKQRRLSVWCDSWWKQCRECLQCAKSGSLHYEHSRRGRQFPFFSPSVKTEIQLLIILLRGCAQPPFQGSKKGTR